MVLKSFNSRQQKINNVKKNLQKNKINNLYNARSSKLVSILINKYLKHTRLQRHVSHHYTDTYRLIIEDICRLMSYDNECSSNYAKWQHENTAATVGLFQKKWMN